MIRELIDELNIKYIEERKTQKIEKISPNLSPVYAASRVFFSSFVDILMAKVF